VVEQKTSWAIDAGAGDDAGRGRRRIEAGSAWIDAKQKKEERGAGGGYGFGFLADTMLEGI
jgi:hypothetical protein